MNDAAENYDEYTQACAAGINADGGPVSDDCPYTLDEGAALNAGVMNTTQTSEHSWGTSTSFAKRIASHQLAVGGDYSASGVSYSQYAQLGSVTGDREAVPDPQQSVELVSGVSGHTQALGLCVTDTCADPAQPCRLPAGLQARSEPRLRCAGPASRMFHPVVWQARCRCALHRA